MFDYKKMGIGLLAFSLFVSSGSFVFAREDDDNRGKGKGQEKKLEMARKVEDKISKGSELEIKKDGRTNIHNAKVLSVSSTTIAVEVALGSAMVPASLSIDASTELISKNQKKITLTNIAAGDMVNVNGMLQTTSAPGLSVKATVVRDLTPIKEVAQENKRVFEGKFISVSSTTPAVLSMTIEGSAFTVQTSSVTLILNKNWLPMNLNAFVAGDSVRVFGSRASSTATTIDAVVVRNASR